MPSLEEIFSLRDRVAIITGGAGLLGVQHAGAIADAGGIPILLDIDFEKAADEARKLSEIHGQAITAIYGDVTDEESIKQAVDNVMSAYGHIDILINNAAIDPKMNDSKFYANHLGDFSVDTWDEEIDVGLKGAFICSKIISPIMAWQYRGVILNIASDLSVIAPDQRIYRKQSVETSFVKPISYSVVKHGLIGLTRWLASYWAKYNVRCNALSPGGVFQHQDGDFVKNLCNLIPVGRMACENEYRGAVIFMCSDSSSYITGMNIIADGGRTIW